MNVADGLLNRLPTGLRLQFHICGRQVGQMPSLYAILRVTKGMPAKPGPSSYDPAKSPPALATSSADSRATFRPSFQISRVG